MVSRISAIHVFFFTSNALKYRALADAFRHENISVDIHPVIPSEKDAFSKKDFYLVLFDDSYEHDVSSLFRQIPACLIPLVNTPRDMKKIHNQYVFTVVWSLDGENPELLKHRLLSLASLMQNQKYQRVEMSSLEMSDIKLNILHEMLFSLDEHLRLSDALSVAAKYFDKIVHYDSLFFYSLWSDNIVLLHGEAVSTRLKDAIHLLSKKFLSNKNPDMVHLIPDFRYSDSQNPIRDEGIRDSLLFPFPSSGLFQGIIGLLSYKENVYSQWDAQFFEDLTRQIEEIVRHLEDIVRKKQEQQILTLFDQVNDAVAIIDLNKKIAYVNHYFQNLMGIYQNIISYDDVKNFFPQKWDRVEKTCLTEKKISRNKVFIGENTKDYFVFDAVTDRFINHPFIEKGLILVARNITDNQRIEDMKAELISNVSHELKTPVAIMKEYVSLMADGIGGTLSKDHQEFNTIIASNLERLERLINNVFDVVKSEKALRKKHVTKIDISELIQEVVNLFKIRYESKKMRLKVQVDKNLPLFSGDRDALLQILVNFLDNAYKYSDENSEVLIFADVRKDGTLYLYVKDYGRGIPKKDQDKIFQRFFRAGLNSQRLPGAGLGLSITKDIVEEMGGNIWFESELHKGSTFYVTIPPANHSTFSSEQYHQTTQTEQLL